MADPGRVFYEIARNLLDEQWRAVYVEELGDRRNAEARVFAASRTNERLGRSSGHPS